MAHYAKLNQENVVVEVIVISNSDELENGQESEAKGVAFCQALTGHQYWKKTSYNGTIRKRYAGIGYTYSVAHDAFIASQPFPSWTLDSETNWEPPVPMPTDGKIYAWDETSQEWQEVTP
jgi:hypothetical protein